MQRRGGIGPGLAIIGGLVALLLVVAFLAPARSPQDAASDGFGAGGSTSRGTTHSEESHGGELRGTSQVAPEEEVFLFHTPPGEGTLQVRITGSGPVVGGSPHAIVEEQGQGDWRKLHEQDVPVVSGATSVPEQRDLVMTFGPRAFEGDVRVRVNLGTATAGEWTYSVRFVYDGGA